MLCGTAVEVASCSLVYESGGDFIVWWGGRIFFVLFVVGIFLVVVLLVNRSISFILVFFFAMGSVAFYTLLERKFLGYFQVRLGPNKVGFKGVPQPVADAMKLFLKEFLLPHGANKVAFMFGPALMLVLCVGV